MVVARPSSASASSRPQPSITTSATSTPSSVSSSSPAQGNPVQNFVSDVAFLLFILLRFLLIPFGFIWKAVNIYFLACTKIYFYRSINSFFSCVNGRVCKCIDLRYIDYRFPPTPKSVNHTNPEGKHFAWFRANELAKSRGINHSVLFADGITADDLGKGDLGDCWLVAAIAALLEFPGLIQRIFVTKEISPLGRYTLRLYDISLQSDGGAAKGRFVNVTVDDLLPCTADGGFPSPLYLQMNSGGEIWPHLIEKALAKWAGSYEKLDGGYPAWALATLTGWGTQSYVKFANEHTWTTCSLRPDRSDSRCPGKIKFESNEGGFDDGEFWSLLKEFFGKKYIMCCSSGQGRDDPENAEDGIVMGHAYTIVGVHEVGDHKLVKLRNPWGKFEWKGKWSNNDSAWEENKDVKAQLKPDFDNRSLFYIDLEDFTKHYRKVDVCHREIRVDTDLFLNVDESDGCVGPLKSCVSGLGSYFCMAKGCYCGGQIELEEELKRKWWKRSIACLIAEFHERRRRRVEGGVEKSGATIANDSQV